MALAGGSCPSKLQVVKGHHDNVPFGPALHRDWESNTPMQQTGQALVGLGHKDGLPIMIFKVRKGVASFPKFPAACTLFFA
jgi:hypothetical protein